MFWLSSAFHCPTEFVFNCSVDGVSFCPQLCVRLLFDCHNGISNIGHSFLLSNGYEKLLLAKFCDCQNVQFNMPWKEQQGLYPCLLVLCLKCFLWFKNAWIHNRSWAWWYCAEVLEKHRIKCCSVLMHMTGLFCCCSLNLVLFYCFNECG